jgi:hypothetical protein
MVGGIIARTLKSHAVIFNRLLPIAAERCVERDAAKLGQKVPEHVCHYDSLLSLRILI